jgi:P4 family phage/plasmid primase-like protien
VQQKMTDVIATEKPAHVTDRDIASLITSEAVDIVRAKKFDIHDTGLGRRLAQYLVAAGIYVWVAGEANGRIWNPTRGIWVEDHSNQIHSVAAELARWNAETENSASALHNIRPVVSMARSHAFKYAELATLTAEASDFDSNPFLIAHPDATTTDLRTGDRYQSRPEDRLTKTTKVAPDSSMASPLFDSFLKATTLGDDTLAEYLQQAVGLTIFNSLPKELAFMLAGPPRSGKSTIVELIISTLGQDLTFGQPNSIFCGEVKENQLADLRGRRIVFVNELGKDVPVKADSWKRMITNGTMTGRQLNVRTATFSATHSFIITTNELPEIPHSDAGVKRRGIVIPFHNQPAVENANLRSEMEGELPAILAWIIDGSRKIYSAEYNLPACVVVESETAKWRGQNDILDTFATGNLIASKGSQIKRSELASVWREFCEGEGVRSPWRVGTLVTVMIERGLATSSTQTRGIYYVNDVRLLAHDENGWTTQEFRNLAAVGDARGDEYLAIQQRKADHRLKEQEKKEAYAASMRPGVVTEPVAATSRVLGDFDVEDDVEFFEPAVAVDDWSFLLSSEVN